MALLGLLAEEFLRLRVVNQDLCQVLLVQDEEVSEAVRLNVGCTSVPSAPCKQTDPSNSYMSQCCYITGKTVSTPVATNTTVCSI